MKKLRYQMEQDYLCDFSGYFSKADIRKFRRQVTEDIIFCDPDGFNVLTLKPSCEIIVHKGYRWDGCSPKFRVLDLFWIGTPDGIVIGSDRKVDSNGSELNVPITNERITHHASAVHDVLGYCKNDPQMPSLFRAYGRELWLSPGRNARDILFFKLLRKKKFLLRYIYFAAVFLFGPFYDLLLGKSSVRRQGKRKKIKPLKG